MTRAFTAVAALLAGDDKELRAGVLEIAAAIKKVNTPAPVKKPVEPTLGFIDSLVYQPCVSRGFLCRKRVAYVPIIIRQEIILDTPAEPKKPAPDIAALAKKTAQKVEEIGDLMTLFRPRHMGGLGVGPNPNAKLVKDGIEGKLRELERLFAKNDGKPSAALEEAGYQIAAIAEVARAKGWPKDIGKRTKKQWQANAENLRAAGLELAKAAANQPQNIRTAGALVNAACLNCHNIYKD